MAGLVAGGRWLKYLVAGLVAGGRWPKYLVTGGRWQKMVSGRFSGRSSGRWSLAKYI